MFYWKDKEIDCLLKNGRREISEMEVGLGRKPITFYAVIWKSLIFNEGSKPNQTISLLSSSKKKRKVQFDLSSWREIKLYYNSK